ncbi:hypothetical protein GBAR_LOCUS4281, partial [Geodia barretti]
HDQQVCTTLRQVWSTRENGIRRNRTVYVVYNKSNVREGWRCDV